MKCAAMPGGFTGVFLPPVGGLNIYTRALPAHAHLTPPPMLKHPKLRAAGSSLGFPTAGISHRVIFLGCEV